MCFLSKAAIPDSFMECHRECCDRFCSWQTQTIEENMSLYQADGNNDDLHWLENAKKYCACEYVDRFQVKSIASEDKVTLPVDKVWFLLHT